MSVAVAERGLTHKRERFVQLYLANGGNATRAASEAGFKHPRQQGSRLLSLPDVQSRIEARVKDAFSLTNLEVIGTLVSQMRADITDLLDENGTVDLVAIKDKRLGHLIRKIRIARAWRPDGTKLEVISLDLHSAQAAAIQLSKILGLEEEARDQAKRAAIRLNVTRAVQRIAEKFDLTFEEAKAMYLRAAPHQARFL